MHFIIHVDSVRLYVEPKMPVEILTEVREKTKYHPNGYKYMPLYVSHAWDGYKYIFYKRDQSCPSGCYRIIKEILKKLGHTSETTFEKNYEPTGEIIVHGLPVGAKLEDYQIDAIESAVASKYGIISAAIRSGKTAMIAGMIAKINHFPAWVLTHSSKELIRQTKKELERFLQRPIGVFSESVYEPEEITVAGYKSLVRIYSKDNVEKSAALTSRNDDLAESIKETKVLILDECQYAFSQKSRDLLEHFVNIGYRIGLSGTPKPDNVTRIEMEATIGPVISKVKFETLIELGRLAQPMIFLYDLPHDWFRVHLSEYPDLYQANIVENYHRNNFIAELVKNLKTQKKTVLVMVARKQHGEILSGLIQDSVYIHGEIDANFREQVFNRLKEKSLSCIISTVGKVGLNIPSLDAVINAEGYEASTLTIQKMRSLTACENKEAGIVIDFMDKGKYTRAHAEERRHMYENLDGCIVKSKTVKKDHFDEQNQK